MALDTKSLREPLEAGLSNVSDKLSDAASQVRDTASDLSRAARKQMDEKLEEAARSVKKSASALYEKAASLPGGETVGGLAHATADYVRDHDVDRMKSDFVKLVRKNPGPALLTALVVGILVGRATRSSH